MSRHCNQGSWANIPHGPVTAGNVRCQVAQANPHGGFAHATRRVLPPLPYLALTAFLIAPAGLGGHTDP